MYHRYIGRGDNAKSAFLFCRVNTLGHTKNLDGDNITSRTSVYFVDNIDGVSGAKMEQMILFAYSCNIDNNPTRIPTNSEYAYYKKLIIYFGNKKYNKIMKNFKSSNSCIGLKEQDGIYRFIYYS
jgi:hypothetical protein